MRLVSPLEEGRSLYGTKVVMVLNSLDVRSLISYSALSGTGGRSYRRLLGPSLHSPMIAVKVISNTAHCKEILIYRVHGHPN